nr:hypothetical protein [Tanacetum cinerariifolium]
MLCGRCTTFEEVAALKEPFDLEKMSGYRSSSKKEFDQRGVIRTRQFEIGKQQLSRCTTFEEVAALKEPFDQVGDDLTTASYPFIAESTADLYAFLKESLLKKPKSLRMKHAPSNSNPLSSKAPFS